MKKLILSLLAIIFISGCTVTKEKPATVDFKATVYENYISGIINIIKNFKEEVRPYYTWKCTYTNGKTIKGWDFLKFEDHKAVIDEEKLEELIETCTKDYNKVPDRDFETTAGGRVHISGGTYGTLVDKEAEKKKIIECFRKGQFLENHKPECVYDYDKLGTSYVEISLADQHVYVYLNGRMVNDTDCVTGASYIADRTTPRGTYYITERINGKYLRGPGYVCWVNKWMRLTGTGIGLHDAVWRSKFGGNIYTYDGSHGCINLPLDFASWLFDNSFVGMPVVIY